MVIQNKTNGKDHNTESVGVTETQESVTAPDSVFKIKNGTAVLSLIGRIVQGIMQIKEPMDLMHIEDEINKVLKLQEDEYANSNEGGRN